MAFGLGSKAGAFGALYHTLNNAVIEGLVFMTFGAIMHALHKEDIRSISIKNDFLLVTSLIGMLSLAGVPLTSGFASKWLIYMASWEINPALSVIAIVISGMTLAYSMKLFSSAFMSPSPRKITVPFSMKVPIAVLSAFCLLIGLFPETGFYMISSAANALFSSEFYSIMAMGMG